MEGLTTRVYAFAGILAVGGLFAHVGTPPAGPPKTEAWMEQTALSTFSNYKMTAADEKDPAVTYKMDADTYKELAPYGIVARDLSNGQKTFDVVLVASQAKASFHDPRVCFTAQGWQLEQESKELVPTSLRGAVPVSVARMKTENGELWAAYFYRGPYGFAATTNDLKLQMFRYSLTNERNADGVFYRFIAEDLSSTKEDLVKFISTYLDASAKQTAGYF